MRNLIFDHWKFKLAALVLAAIAWLFSSGRDYTTAKHKITLTLEPPAGGVILQVNDMSFTGELDVLVELYGPRRKIDSLEGEPLTAKYSFEGINVGDIELEPHSVTVKLKFIRIRLENNALPLDIEIREAEPEVVEVKIDRLVSKDIKVKPALRYMKPGGSSEEIESLPTGKGCLDGYQIMRLVSNPTAVTIWGPASVLKDVDAISTRPTLVGDLDATVDRKVDIVPFVEDPEHPEYGRVSIECQKEVAIKITVTEVLESRTLKGVPIRFLQPPKYFPIVEITKIDGKAADAKNPTVDIVITGPGKQLAGVRSEDLTVFLDLTEASRGGEFTQTPGVRLPEGIRLDRGPGKPPPVPSVTYEVKLIELK